MEEENIFDDIVDFDKAVKSKDRTYPIDPTRISHREFAKRKKASKQAKKSKRRNQK